MDCFYLTIVKEIFVHIIHKFLETFVSKIVAERKELTNNQECHDANEGENVCFHIVVEVSGVDAC